MQYAKIHALVGHVPFISKENATFVYELMVRNKLRNILELGIAHGTATCVMAAALEEIGGGKITAVDLLDKKEHYDPTPEEQLKRSGLSQFVEIVRTKTGYNWFLHDDILANTKHGICAEVYDLCLIDGPKNWTVDGAAFFMADKLLKKDGWMVFDDYLWTCALSGTVRGRSETDGIQHRELSEDELKTPHIREVFELLVKQHPNYGSFLLLDDDWAIAQKTQSQDKTYTMTYRDERSIVSAARSLVYALQRKLFGGFKA